VVKEFGAVAQEVNQNLTALVRTDVEITVEISARKTDGFDDAVVRVVTENATVPKFDEHRASRSSNTCGSLAWRSESTGRSSATSPATRSALAFLAGNEVSEPGPSAVS